MKQKTKFYNHWGFWVVAMIALLLVLGAIVDIVNPTTETKIVYKDNPQTQAELNACEIQLNELTNATENYFDALDDYCKLDQYNLICLAR